MQIRQLLERIGNPVSLHVACAVVTEKEIERAPSLEMCLGINKHETVEALLEHLRPIVRVECEPYPEVPGAYRIQADIVAMSRDEFAKVMLAAYRVGRHDIGPAEDVA